MNNRISIAVALAALLMGASAALAYAQGVEIIAPDTARRAVQVLIGLMLAAYANLMPKDVGRWRSSPVAAARVQSALRVGGWSLTLAGLTYAVLWASAPMNVANIASMAVVAVALLITTAYAAWTLLACRSKTTA